MTDEPDRDAFVVTLLPSGQSFPVAADQSILEAAASAGLRLPSSCRNGTCRACLCRMIEGSVAYRVDWPGLSADEKTAGWILPCVALPATNVTIEQPHFVHINPADSADTNRRKRGRGF
jgi:ferredoxin